MRRTDRDWVRHTVLFLQICCLVFTPASLSWSAGAEAEPPSTIETATPWLRLLTHEEWLRLSPEGRVQYLVGLRLLMQDWEEWQKQNRRDSFASDRSTEAELFSRWFYWLVPTVEANVNPRADITREERRQSPAAAPRELLGPPAPSAAPAPAPAPAAPAPATTAAPAAAAPAAPAPAAATGEPREAAGGVRVGPDANACLYAGWIQGYANGSSLCQQPPACQGQEGSFQCNPILVGPGVCVPARTREDRIRATSTCLRSGKSVEEIAEYLKTRKTEWDAYVARFRSASTSCQRDQQQEVCWIIQRRLAQLNQLLGGQALPDLVRAPTRGGGPAPAPGAAPAAAPATRDRGERTAGSAPVQRERPAATASGGRSDPGPVARSCSNNLVIGEMSIPNRPATMVMDLQQGYDFACRGQYDASYLEARRGELRRHVALLGQRRDGEANYYRRYFGDLLANLNACQRSVDQAKTAGRSLERTQTHRITFGRGNNPEIGYLEPLPGARLRSLSGASPGYMGAHRTTLGMTLSVQGVDLCATRIDGGGVGAPQPVRGTR